MKLLKAQLTNLERQHKPQSVFTFVDDPWRWPSASFVRTSFDPQPLPTSLFLQTSSSLNLWSKELAKIKARKASPTRSTSFDSINKIPSSSKGKGPSGSRQNTNDSIMMTFSKAPDVLPTKEKNGISSFLQALTQSSSKASKLTVDPVIASQIYDDISSESEEGTSPHSYDKLHLTDEFEHLFMNEAETTERASDIEDETSQSSPRTSKRTPNTDSEQIAEITPKTV
ncbi:hypothetical protein Hanom_Chr10g00873201 [Helianthus anomalus]